MTVVPPREGVPSVEELMGHILLIADSANESHKDSKLVREETRSALKKFEETNGKVIKDIAAQADYLKKSYAPSALREFKAESDDVLGRLDKAAARVTSRFAVRLAIIIALVAAAAASAVWWVPTLTEIADRQATIHRLQEQIGAFESLKGHLVRNSEGQWYIRYDGPVSCATSNPADGSCYIPFPK